MLHGSREDTFLFEHFLKIMRGPSNCSFGRIQREARSMLAVPVLMAAIMPSTFGQVPAAESPGQTTQPDQAQPKRSPENNRQITVSREATNATEKRRLSVNPLTGLATTSGAYTPLTGEERWKLYWKQNSLSVGAYFGPFLAALVLDQATGSPAQWGGGFAGYGRRVGSRTASAIIQGSIQAPTAALLHEDVRYIASTRRGVKKRFLHAITYSFLTYNNQGHPTLNIANLAAYYASTAISTAWLPGRYNVASYTLTNGSEQIALTLPINLLQEFWPEIRRKVLGKP
jgi:hypothetical protein